MGAMGAGADYDTRGRRWERQAMGAMGAGQTMIRESGDGRGRRWERWERQAMGAGADYDTRGRRLTARGLTEGQFTCSVPVAACHGVPHCSLL